MKVSSTSRLRRSSTPEALLMTSLVCAAGTLSAQTPAAPATDKPADEPATDLPEVVVEGNVESLYKPEALQSPKFTEPLRDIPQTVTVIPRAVMEDRGAFSLRDVLRNTPGISMQAGEGGATGGDNLSIRGFNSRGDIFVDGVRDYGNYNRDPFNTEQVEITKGPASSNAGRGATGGSINLATKMANPTKLYSGAFSVGSDDLIRTTVDVNQPISDHMALRVNLLQHNSDTPGRDVVTQERYGIASSLAFGLGTDTRLFLNYQHLTEHNIPDYGIPFVPNNGTFVGTGAGLAGYIDQAPPVDFDSFYGREGVDFEDVQSDIATAIFEHDFNDHVRLRNILRYGRTYRHSVTTAPRFFDTDAGTAGNQYTSALNRQLQRREMTNEILSNQVNLNANFETGPLKHALVTGMDLAFERQLNANASLAAPAARTDVFNPNPNDPATGLPVLPGAAEAHLDTIAFYLFDTVNIGEHWEVSGGVRYDHVEADARGANGVAGFSNVDDLFSWKAAVVYKPVEIGSIYFGYGTSFNPSIDGGAGLALTGAIANLDPEETRAMEFGTKWDLINERLSISAALFRTEKTNARVAGLAAGTTELAGNQVVEGIEFGAAGNITDKWHVIAGYAYMRSESEAPTTATAVLGNTPDHSFNIWTTYDLPQNVQVGFGAQYVGDRKNGNLTTSRTAPGFWTMDAMVAYKVNDNLTLRLNIYNLADERYIDRVGGGHFVPGQGRSAALTASLKF